MKFHHILVFTLAAALFSACGNKAESNSDIKSISAPAPKSGIEVSAASLGMPKDPVCEMPIKDGEIADTAMYEGKSYGFCSKECKAEFAKNPTQYLTQK
jgi:YHS domain-containing protein